MTTEVASFSTEPMLDLHDPRIQRTLLAALAELDESLPVQVRIHVAGEKLAGSGEFTAHDPAWWERVTAEARIAGEGEIGRAHV